MNTIRGRHWTYHLIFWAGIYGLWIFLFRGYTINISRTATVELCYLLFITADVYGIRALFRSRRAMPLALRLMLTVILILISAVLRAAVAAQMSRYVFHLPPTGTLRLFGNSLLNISCWTLVILGLDAMLRRSAAQKRAQLLEQQRLAAELSYLKAQMNPHMLFNSLNTLYGSIDKENAEARRMLLQFSDMLRHQLYECDGDRITLQSELHYLDNYIALQKARCPEGLQLSVALKPCTGELCVAPLLLIVLVENAFKHLGHVPGAEPHICIEVSHDAAEICCRVRNTTDREMDGPGSKSPGIGLINLRRRLELIYPDKHRLHIARGDGYYEANLHIQHA